MAREWSWQQNDIFNFVQNGTGNGIVRAVAGSGKTTTMVHAQSLAKGNKIFLAFNKAIADELKARGVNARTFHSVCYSPVTQSRGVRDLDMNKNMRVWKAATQYRDFAYRKQVNQMVNMAKQIGMGLLVPETEDLWMSIVNHHSIDFNTDSLDVGRGIELASEVFEAHMQDFQLNFDDLLYFAAGSDIGLPKFDWVFVDEAQDTNAIQRAIIRKLMHENSRIICVGDEAQAIYGFRGADSDSMKLLQKEFNMESLPLSVTYRCPTSVVKYAQQWVEEIQAAPNAPEGVVQNLKQKWELTTFQPGDLVVCRTVRQILALGFKLIREQIPAVVMGREIGEGLKALIKRMNTTDLDELSRRIEAWRDREVQKALKDDNEMKAEEVYDKADAIINIIEGMPEDMRTYDQLIAVVEYLFHPSANAITLATIHKSKGLEANRVFWLNRSACPARWAKQQWEHQQELNLCYVAATRAKQELYFIEEKAFGTVQAPGEVLVGKGAVQEVAKQVAADNGVAMAEDGPPWDDAVVNN